MNEDFSQTRLDIDVDFYRSLHPDLHVLTDSQLAEHYHRCGEHEGRPASPLSFVNILLDSIRSSEDALEVGPNCSPKLKGERARYFDVLDSAGLAARAASAGAPGQIAPHIDYVSPLGDLSIVETAAFDAIFSSHCIEYVPDLIRHLNQAARILRPGGRYLLMIPDKRYCHDHYIAASTVAEVIQVYHEQRHPRNRQLRPEFRPDHAQRLKAALGGGSRRAKDLRRSRRVRPGYANLPGRQRRLYRSSYLALHPSRLSRSAEPARGQWFDRFMAVPRRRNTTQHQQLYGNSDARAVIRPSPQPCPHRNIP
jgi:SAM-dependent methyltransferase